MSRRADNTSPRSDHASTARQFSTVGMTAGILSGTSAALMLADQPAGATGVSSAGYTPTAVPTMAGLVSGVPKLSLVPVSPGTSTPSYSATRSVPTKLR